MSLLGRAFGALGRLARGVLRSESSFAPAAATQTNDSGRIIDKVRELIERKESRYFAVVHLLGKQWRITDGDLLVVEGYWPPTLGDRIRLEKVLLAGGADFTLIGRPLVQPGLVDIEATIVAKTLAHTKTRFRKKRRKQFMRINFHRSAVTTLRINSIRIGPDLDRPSNVF